ncbi:MAG: hypothetical protein GVY24_01855, partial [Planctomycetes bacterium]|nr:hypothetical protein [Planctomycetota bacterium]
MLTLSITLSSAICSRASAQQLEPVDFASLGTLDLTSGSYTIDTDTLTIFNDAAPGTPLFTGVVDDQNGEADYSNGNWVPGTQGIPEIAVFTFDQIDLGAAASVNITGTRAIALLSRGNATIGTPLSVDGADASLNGTGSAGAGGFNGGGFAPTAQAGDGPGGGEATFVFGSFNDGRAGAGSFGGSGVKPAITGGNGDPGPTYGDLTSRLQGGSGGGANAINTGDTSGTVGGGGGGAIELGAAGILAIDADVRARGGDRTGEAGAGSGGGIRVHASQVQLDADLIARGGGASSTIEPNLGGGGRIYVVGDTASQFVYALGEPAPVSFDAFPHLDVRPGLQGDGTVPSDATLDNFGVLTISPGLTIVPTGESLSFGQVIDASGPDIKLEVLPFDARVLDGGEADIGGGLTTAASQEI